MITAQYLLEGAMYALEQCGILLHDAVILYNNGSYANAIVLAAFAREEMGRSRILREFRKDIVERGVSVTLGEIKEKCENHVKKQEYAQLSVTQRFSSQQGRLAQLSRVRIRSHPQSDEWKDADKELNKITKLQKKRTPEDRHKERMSALYVEPNEYGTRWSRPKEKTQEAAKIFIEDSANDYRVQRENIRQWLEYHSIPQADIPGIDNEFFRALSAWPERPKLPPPD
jgi:AbiV family abortive infection protein